MQDIGHFEFLYESYKLVGLRATLMYYPTIALIKYHKISSKLVKIMEPVICYRKNVLCNKFTSLKDALNNQRCIKTYGGV